MFNSQAKKTCTGGAQAHYHAANMTVVHTDLTCAELKMAEGTDRDVGDIPDRFVAGSAADCLDNTMYSAIFAKDSPRPVDCIGQNSRQECKSQHVLRQMLEQRDRPAIRLSRATALSNDPLSPTRKQCECLPCNTEPPTAATSLQSRDIATMTPAPHNLLVPFKPRLGDVRLPNFGPPSSVITLLQRSPSLTICAPLP